MSVAVVGAGNWGRNLVRNLYVLNSLDAVVDPSPEILAVLAEQYPAVPLFSNLTPVLESDISAVVVATPAHTHYDIARRAIEAGKDVFVEKPLTLTVAEAEDLVALAERRNRILMTGHLLLYQPAIRWIKSYLDSGALGQVYSFHQERLNLGRARAVENVLWSFGVHDVAVLLHLIGESPVEVTAMGQRVLQNQIEDDIYLHLGFGSGMVAHLHASWLWPEKRRRLVIVGSQGMLVYDEATQSVTLHRKGITSGLENWDEGTEVVFEGSGEPLRLELEHFLEAVRYRTRPISDGTSALEVLRVLEMASQQLKGVSL